ncbi:MAG TPA: ABC transporter permease [Vicinamibacterales bacterium]|jgi:predicted permease
MSLFDTVIGRMRAVWSARQLDARLREEFQDHLDRATGDNIARGMAPADARRAALIALGGVAQTAEACRDVSPLAPFHALCQDVRYALRVYRKTPIVTAATILTSTLAIGAATTLFTLLNALVLRELPVREPASLVHVAPQTTDGREIGASYAMFRQLEASPVFESVMGTWWSGESTELDGEVTLAGVWAITGNVYGELGLRPVIGRLLGPNDVALAPPAMQQVAVIGHAFWQRHFHGDPGALGRRVEIDDVPFTIVGVAPAGFAGFGVSAEPDITVPLPAVALIRGRTLESIARRTSQWIDVVARLRSDVTLDQARAQLSAQWPAIQALEIPPDLSPGERAERLAQRISVKSASNGREPWLRPQFTSPLVITFGIAALILAIACTNLSGLMLARTTARGHEMAVRLALGASRWRVARQLVTEGVLLATIGGLGGLLCAAWASRSLSAVIFEDYVVTIAFDAAPDGRAVAFTIMTSLCFGLLLTLIPAWRATREQPFGLQRSTRTVTSSTTGRWLVAAQVALSLVLLIAAGLFVRTLQAIRSVPSGMTTKGVVVAYPFQRPAGYGRVDNDVYYRTLVEALEAIPGVERASVSLDKPAGGGSGIVQKVARTSDPVTGVSGVDSIVTKVSPNFFAVLGLSVQRGRDVSWTDTSHARKVAVVSEALARHLFNGRPAIGQHVRIGTVPARQDMEIVGVVSNARLYNLKDTRLDAIYIPALQDADVNSKCFVIRAAGVPFDAIRRAVDSSGIEFITNIRTLDYTVGRALLRERLVAALATFFGIVGAVLAAIGVFALMSYSVEHRRREIGIRMALGAEPVGLVIGVVRDGARIALGGVAAGLVAALLAAQAVGAFLFGIAPRDPVTLGVASLALLFVSIVACVIPAIRAARVDPLIALRAE